MPVGFPDQKPYGMILAVVVCMLQFWAVLWYDCNIAKNRAVTKRCTKTTLCNMCATHILLHDCYTCKDFVNVLLGFCNRTNVRSCHNDTPPTIKLIRYVSCIVYHNLTIILGLLS